MDEFYYEDLRAFKDDLDETILFNRLERLTLARDIGFIYLLLFMKYNNKKEVRKYFLDHTKKYYKEISDEKKILKHMKNIINNKYINIDKLDDILEELYSQYLERYSSYEKVFKDYEDILAYNSLNDYNYKVLEYKNELNCEKIIKKINSL